MKLEPSQVDYRCKIHITTPAINTQVELEPQRESLFTQTSLPSPSESLLREPESLLLGSEALAVSLLITYLTTCNNPTQSY
jgi:hypothetical protein